MNSQSNMNKTYVEGIVIAFLIHMVYANISSKISKALSDEENKTKTKIVKGIGSPHPSSKLPLYKDCIYADYNATTPVFEGIYITLSF